MRIINKGSGMFGLGLAFKVAGRIAHSEFTLGEA
jgi:hypothetical protein